MKVSVCIQTYNHEPFIAQAIDSALMQQTDFGFEILVGEDDSSDGTRDICREYAQRYPKIIRLFLNSRENVIYINGKPTGRWNYMNNLRHAQGEYIAILDGDDYWTDPLKLQKQVDLMDSDRSLSMSGHRFATVGSSREFVGTSKSMQARGTLDAFLRGYWFKSCTIVWRRSAISRFPRWMYTIFNADSGIHLLCLENGDAGFINEEMATYRVHDGGIWSAATRRDQLLAQVGTYRAFEKHLSHQYRHHCRRRLSTIYTELSALYESEGNHREAFRWRIVERTGRYQQRGMNLYHRIKKRLSGSRTVESRNSVVVVSSPEEAHL